MSSTGSPEGATTREKRTVEVELLGRRFRVRSDDDDAYIRQLVDYVNRKMMDMRRAANAMDVEQIALLTLLDVADALFRERARGEALESGVREHAERISTLLDRLEQVAPDVRELVTANAEATAGS